ncbi:MAG: hypothetical protein AAFW81_01185 [Pseudomonadota bacterium]
MQYHPKVQMRLSAIAFVASLCAVAASCAGKVEQTFGAYGFLSPAPTGQGELIGVYDTRAECQAAAENWMSRQVVGNPVSAECYPSDPD